ncbi:adenosylcobyric acid synthase [Clostridium acetobutylicum]|uniref:Cobyric acid synthase n=1 Tax=Clostridium acetobutylicum (strain ATCC 824 / DSM 792 / JCM 1419 / IAM 19013 / LMG 5710 / NBRC 13948 / NRRL B-527 / VKM B-1787 / 2291 / W) TaxID=272562 RepID=COBQ_CLOAB|nr:MULTISPECIES: cobyric acid synthase [Clostridium]Q97JB2.1 RecName: Full=Cobyric acid synthase [Clostridium acetobutylicum ATCC 824]AAK79342.1 Cobyric acid synthase CbiP [Clostridium acetobutylicum ATCC 824]ADZ20425.1 cobyric acid synthase [Clostridium acetobutylicum EA 2018]AEI33556.1 cobyric acid synthase [Clostridium acetobutylicum DSM 1731]AWV81409.1 cobyric acid synthase [Clostridium acetobutylicum]MBC2393044.1 cobyric acid synthase [Clostridium acetobutylicum]
MSRIMIQGTASSVGKSILVAALCRIFKQDGFSVCPYKSQNMSLNSYITLDGKEMGRAQVLQAYAAGLEPEVYMNPILLKPTTDKSCQVIVKGEVYGVSSAKNYYNMKKEFAPMLKEDFEELEDKFDIVVIEGAGSPAEINLRENDIVNMGLAELVDAPVVLVGDIDKGGVFASLFGTVMLLEENERKRIKGTIINKFRGDVEILKPGLSMLEERINIPCFGVVPYFNLSLEDEDGAVYFNTKVNSKIDVAVIKLPHISNFTDIDALKIEEDVSLRYITSSENFGTPDLLIIPGSKNTIGDLLYIRKNGIENKIKQYAEKNGLIFGICGGYQMLGRLIEDPFKVETELGEINGMGLLDIRTVFAEKKVTTRVQGSVIDKQIPVYGYEIHMGISSYGEKAKPFIKIENKVGIDDGAVNEGGNIMGTYIHGIFDGANFREYIINFLRDKKGIERKKSVVYEDVRNGEIDRLADIVRNSLDMNSIYSVMGIEGKK